MDKKFLIPLLGILLASSVYAICCNYECFLPSTLGDNVIEDIGASGETTLEQILTTAGYFVSLPNDQSQIQVWEATQDVEIEIEYIGGISSYVHVFGYYLNHDADTFVPVFKTANIPGYESAPLASEGPFTININEDDYVGFAIIIPDQCGGIFYATENALNPGAKDRAIVIDKCDEFLIGFEDMNDWDYQDLVVSISRESCEEPVPEPLKIIAHKIVCEDESSLPNWGLGGPSITQTTAQDFVNSHEGCEFEEDWYFQWGFETEISNPGDNTGEAGGNWNTFGPTNSNGKASTLIYELLNNKIWVREVWGNDYIGFTYNLNNQTNVDDVSAELYCHIDVLNYDNYDFILNPQPENEYYCVAFNVKGEKCGNGELDPGEQCDGNEPPVSCETQEGYQGWISCLGDCTWGNCNPYEYCGDNEINGPETCDWGEANTNKECDNSEEDCEYCTTSCKIIELKYKEECDKCKSNSGFNELVFECEPNWKCSGWSECVDGVMTRNCEDTHFCEFNYNKPSETTGCQEGVSSTVFLTPKDEGANVPIGIWILLALIVIAIIIVLVNQL